MKKLLSAIVVTVLLAGAGCLGGTNVQIKPVALTYWRPVDDPKALDAAIAEYRKLRPNVSVTVTQVRAEDYERTLLEALAENRGPDLFSIPNTWLGGWRGKIMPMPKEITLPVQEAVDGKVVTQNKKLATMNVISFQNQFVEGVTDELVAQIVSEKDKAPVSVILGLPYSADTLGMYYNRDAFRRGNWESAPKNWKDLQDAAIKLTTFEPLPPGADAFTAPKVIRQSGAALGLARNVTNATDLISAIMLQNGAKMADGYGYASFQAQGQAPESRGAEPPGAEALQFYQSFAVPQSQNYSWNVDQPQSFDAFVTGKTAMYFGFPSEAAEIRRRAPSLDFGLAPLPQVYEANPKNVLHYPVEVVSAKTKSPNEAWDFLQFAANAEQVKPFLDSTKRPTALRSLIAGQLNDPEIGPFAGQTLTAESWYKGTDYAKVEQAFATMLETYPTFERPQYQPIVAAAAAAVNQTIQFR